MNEHKFVVMTEMIKEAMKAKLSLPEFLVLMYFDNSYDKVFDISLISDILKINENIILEAFNNLLNKKVIKMVTAKDYSDKYIDKVSLEDFYNNIELSQKKEQEKTIKEDIFTKFETEFGRPLSSMEIEVIKTWMEKLYTEELILAALGEAVYNGVTNIRYIDKILYEWNKKGFKNKEDVTNHLKNRYDNKRLEETNIFDYNWLDEYDK